MNNQQDDIALIQGNLTLLDSLMVTVEPGFGLSDEWKPLSAEGISAVNALIDPANRLRLRMWYSLYPENEMNSTAIWFKKYLEQKIGERL